jgi:predicted RNase H-like nuclease (RuvC/YqgF family)
MKNYFKVCLGAAIFLSACNTDNTDYKKFVYRVDSLNIAISARDSTINDFISSFNDIEKNLDSVSLKQGVIATSISKKGTEMKENIKERINQQIAGINDLMEQNRNKIEELKKNLNRNSYKISQFKKMIAELNDQIVKKDQELEALNTQLNTVNAQVAELKTSMDTLTSKNSSQSQTIADQTASMHTAYYLIGKSKDLESMKVIDKKGGLLGIGKTPKLNSDFNKDIFKKIDYTQVMTIPINSKKATIITAHPSDSYSLEKENDQYTNLKIIQPEKFWSASKYLVVVNN